MGSWRGRAQDERGAQTVEFALVLPVLLLLVLGIINFGYLFGQKLSLNQAVREGARLAVVPNSLGQVNGTAVDTYAEIRDVVRGATGGLVTPSQVSVNVNKNGAADGTTNGCKSLKVGDQLQVKSTYTPTRWLVPLPIGLAPPTLTSRAVYRCEWQG